MSNESKSPAGLTRAESAALQVFRQASQPSSMPHTQAPLTFIVVGASGDLAKKKTYPSLLKLFVAGYLPNHTAIIGYARSDYSDESFRARLRTNLSKFVAEFGEEQLERFLQLCKYHRGSSYGDHKAWAGLHQIATGVETAVAAELGCSKANRVFYYAIPPNVFADAGAAIKANCMTPTGWNRMIIEKPFGRDSESSALLAEQLRSLFTEDQLYRIDHYLGKEVVQNLLVLRFGNMLLQPQWNRNYIRSVIISFKEPFGTEGRGGYFDNYGIIRDVMQNHLLQILSLISMEPPVCVAGSDYSNYVRNEKVKVLRCIRPLTRKDIIVGQYVASEDGTKPGYLDDDGVPADSVTPTYAMAKFEIANARWDGVPFIIKCGKALNSRKAEIRIQFKSPPGAKRMFGDQNVPLNELVIRVQPNDAVYMKVNIKAPGFQTNPLETDMDLTYGDRFGDLEVPDAYTRLILDVLRGKQATFVRDDELEAAWAIFSPLLHELESSSERPLPYAYGSRGPPEADEFISQFYTRSQSYIWRGKDYGSMSDATPDKSNPGSSKM